MQQQRRLPPRRVCHVWHVQQNRRHPLLRTVRRRHVRQQMRDGRRLQLRRRVLHVRQVRPRVRRNPHLQDARLCSEDRGSDSFACSQQPLPSWRIVQEELPQRQGLPEWRVQPLRQGKRVALFCLLTLQVTVFSHSQLSICSVERGRNTRGRRPTTAATSPR